MKNDKLVVNGKLVVSFDVDDTLLIPGVASGFGRDTPNYDVIAIYRWFQAQGNYMIIWSGGGIDYAKTWAEKLGLTADEFAFKQKREDIDIAFDDCDVDLAKVNIKVKRINNQISRNEPNEREDKTNTNKKENNPPLTKCPKCGSRKYVISIFGRICPDCFYEEKK